jgi:hypothetical protein
LLLLVWAFHIVVLPGDEKTLLLADHATRISSLSVRLYSFWRFLPVR